MFSPQEVFKVKKLLLGLIVLAATFASLAHANGSSFSDRAVAERLKPVGQVCLQGEECADAVAVEDTAEADDEVAGEVSGEDLFNSKGCTACHSIDNKIVGPAFKDVAAKGASASTLAGHIKNGSVGEWGSIPMPPNNVTEDEANTLAEWVLSLN